MPRIEIPVDVLLNILDYVDKADLATICLLNKICCSCSQDVLYRDIHVKNRKILWTLAKSTDLARKVRSFNLCSTGSKLAMALRNMTSLRILNIQTLFDMDILVGCTFKLDSFECFYTKCRVESFLKFFSSQPSLKYLKIPLCSDSAESSLEATGLPNLTRIESSFLWLKILIPGSPVNEVITTGYTSNEHSIDLSFFTLSTAPIQNLTIDYSFLYPTPGHLLASFLPSLTHLTLRIGKYFTTHGGVCGLPLY